MVVAVVVVVVVVVLDSVELSHFAFELALKPHPTPNPNYPPIHQYFSEGSSVVVLGGQDSNFAGSPAVS